MTLKTAIGALLKSTSCALMEAATGVYIFYRRRTAVTTSTLSTRGMELSLYFLSLKVFAGGLVTLFVQVKILSNRLAKLLCSTRGIHVTRALGYVLRPVHTRSYDATQIAVLELHTTCGHRHKFSN
jgi:hypothetical protein